MSALFKSCAACIALIGLVLVSAGAGAQDLEPRACSDSGEKQVGSFLGQRRKVLA